MRWTLALVFLVVGCAQEPAKETPKSSKPGAPIVSFIGLWCGRLADGRVFDFDTRHFRDEVAGARTISENGQWEIGRIAPATATCFAREDSVLRCFGSSVDGGLAGADGKDDCVYAQGGPLLDFGDGGGEQVHYACAKDPVVVPGAPPVTSISGSCALSEGSVFCWGKHADSIAPSILPGLDHGMTKISSDYADRRVCALRDDGRALCADRTPGTKASPVTAIDHVIDVSVGIGAGCFLDESGAAWCYDEFGEGIATSTDAWSPARVDTAIRFSKIDVTIGTIACGVTRERMVACWGRLGGGAPHLLPGFVDVIDVATGGNDVMVLRADGSVARVQFDEKSSSSRELAP